MVKGIARCSFRFAKETTDERTTVGRASANWQIGSSEGGTVGERRFLWGWLGGEGEGTIALKGNSPTVGPHGQVKASVEAKGVVVQGKLEGNIQASDRVELRKTATVTGDIATQRISIEEGAYLKGKVDIQGRAEAKGATTK